MQLDYKMIISVFIIIISTVSCNETVYKSTHLVLNTEPSAINKIYFAKTNVDSICGKPKQTIRYELANDRLLFEGCEIIVKNKKAFIDCIYFLNTENTLTTKLMTFTKNSTEVEFYTNFGSFGLLKNQGLSYLYGLHPDFYSKYGWKTNYYSIQFDKTASAQIYFLEGKLAYICFNPFKAEIDWTKD